MRSSIGNLDSKKLYTQYFDAKRKSQSDIKDKHSQEEDEVEEKVEDKKVIVEEVKIIKQGNDNIQENNRNELQHLQSALLASATFDPT